MLLTQILFKKTIGWIADNTNTPTNAVGGEYGKLLNGDIPYIKYDDLLKLWSNCKY